MKTKDIKALHQKTPAELQQQQAELELKLAKTRIEKKAGKLANTSSLKLLADDLARVKTIQREQQLAKKEAKS